MNVATVASDTVWKDVAKNLELTEQHVAKVLELFPQTQVILFPEISLAGFMVEAGNKDVAQPIDGPAVHKVCEIAQKYGVALICGFVEANSEGKPYNTQFVASKEGQVLASYRKNHLFTESTEPETFTVGEKLTTFELEGWKCGLSTCFDIRFPRLFEAYGKAGVECMFAGFNWVEGRNKPEIMKHLVSSRAHENQFFFAAVDRSGSDPNTSYYATSIIANPYAEDIAQHEGIYAYAELNKDDITTLHAKLPLAGSFKESYSL